MQASEPKPLPPADRKPEVVPCIAAPLLRGLTSAEAIKRLAAEGPNELPHSGQRQHRNRAEFERMDDAALEAAVQRVNVFARIVPVQKLRIDHASAR